MAVWNWHCQACGTPQDSSAFACIDCGVPRPAAAEDASDPVRFIVRRDFDTLGTVLAGLDGDSFARSLLLSRLKSAAVIGENICPPDLVGLLSQVDLRIDDCPPMRRVLTAGNPGRADSVQLSALTPLGDAILGCRSGDRSRYRDRRGQDHLVSVEKVQRRSLAPPNGAVRVIEFRPRTEPVSWLAAPRKGADPDGAA